LTTDRARVTLGMIRLINGLLCLLVPGIVIRRISVSPESNPAAVYAFRMFGIRTVLIGLDLLRPRSRDRDHAVGLAPIVHGSDLLTAGLLAASGQLKPATCALIVGISGLNTVLAVLIARGSRET
jgi:hypothetical protein